MGATRVETSQVRQHVRKSFQLPVAENWTWNHGPWIVDPWDPRSRTLVWPIWPVIMIDTFDGLIRVWLLCGVQFPT